jgi:translocation and assembly module TamA
MLVCLFAQAQTYTLHVMEGKESTYFSVSDSFSAINKLREQVVAIRNGGYLAASADSLWAYNDTLHALILKDIVYEFIHIRSHNITSGYLPLAHTTLTRSAFLKLQNEILTSYEQSGYPFAIVYLLEPKIAQDTLTCVLLFDPYLKFTYDTLAYTTDCSISKSYLSTYLDMEEGGIYNELEVREIDKKLRNLPLIKLNSPSRIVFYEGLARLILNISDVVTDRVDGIVGFAPNSANSAKNRLLITGEVNVELNNLFKSGKQIALNWRNYLQNSQKLDVNFTYPYLFNTKLGINGEFSLNKFDTVFVNLKSKLSFRYQQKGNNYLQFYYQNISSNLLSVDTNVIRSVKRIPTNNPFKIDNYGMAAFQQDFDYLPNPRKGYAISADMAVGQKTLLRNTQINQVKYVNTENGKLISIYDTINIRSLRLDFKILSTLYIPIKKRGTFRQQIQFDALFAKDILFNELYNIGGFSSLRGFDENEIFASKLFAYTAEYRYLIGENSNVGLFVNAAAIENILESTVLVKDIPFGFGALANIQVGKGILNLAFALGSQQGNTIKLNSGKFHFGVVNYF